MCLCEFILYLAATLPRSICTGTHSSLQVAGLAVRSWDVTLALGALWEMWKQTTPSFCYQQHNRLREELPECVLALCFTKPLKLHSKMKMLPLSSHSHVSWNITEVHLNTKPRGVFSHFLKVLKKEWKRPWTLSQSTGSFGPFCFIARQFMKNFSYPSTLNTAKQ